MNMPLPITETGTGMHFPVPPLLKKLGALCFWLGLVWFFIFVFAPWLQHRSEAIATLSDYIDESGIDAGALYYSEVEEVGRADITIRDTLRFYYPERSKHPQEAGL